MSDMRKVTEPKSDQWNFDDFQAGPLTFTIEAVRVKSGQEQPVEITLAGTPKFYRPCKSMSRCLVAAWGADSSKYVGRSLTLYGDPKVKWGGLEVGGIRISHMSDIESALTMALTVTRANKKPFTVKPLVQKAAPPQTEGTQGQPGIERSGPPEAPGVQRIDEALGFASKELKGRFIALVATYGVKTVAELDAKDQEKARRWLQSEVDKENAKVET